MAGCRRARWQLLGVVGQEGQIAGVVGQEGDEREPDGAGAVGVRRARWLGREGWQNAGGPDGSCWGSGLVGGSHGVGIQDGVANDQIRG